MSLLSVISTIAIIIPVVPLIIYLVGLVVPATHIVSRSSTFKISLINLWSILTDVSKYPEWQHKVQKVIIDEIDINENESKKVVFVEYSTSKRQTLVINHELVPQRRLVRILEESPRSIIGDKYQFKNKIPTFSGSWTFEITQEKEDDNQVTLKITEQGVIKNSFARITHLLLLRYHYRIDRFLNDLHTLVDKEYKVSNDVVMNDNKESALLESDNNEKSDSVADSQIGGVNDTASNEKIEITDDVIPDQVAEANDNSMVESKVVSGEREWDLVSEIYERPPQPTTQKS